MTTHYEQDEGGIVFISNRRPGDVRIPNYVYDIWMPLLGIETIGIYAVYCRLERNDMIKGMSLKTLSKAMRIGERTVRNANKVLERYGFIKVTTPQGFERTMHWTTTIEVFDPPTSVPQKAIEELQPPSGYEVLTPWLAECKRHLTLPIKASGDASKIESSIIKPLNIPPDGGDDFSSEEEYGCYNDSEALSLIEKNPSELEPWGEPIEIPVQGKNKTEKAQFLGECPEHCGRVLVQNQDHCPVCGRRITWVGSAIWDQESRRRGNAEKDARIKERKKDKASKLTGWQLHLYMKMLSSSEDPDPTFPFSDKAKRDRALRSEIQEGLIIRFIDKLVDQDGKKGAALLHHLFNVLGSESKDATSTILWHLGEQNGEEKKSPVVWKEV